MRHSRVIAYSLFAALASTDCSAQVSPPPPVAGPPEHLARAPRLPEGTPPEIADPESFRKPVNSLADAMARAYWTNPTLIAQRSTLNAADFRVPQARSGYGPKLEASAIYGWQQGRIGQPIGNDLKLDGWTTTAQAILTQPLYTFGRTAASERSALAWRTYQSEVLRSAEQQTMADAISVYVLVLRDRAGVQIAEDNLDLLERELADNEARLRVREATISDVDQVRTRVELARATLLVAESALEASEARFLRVVGSPAGELLEPAPLQLPFASVQEAQRLIEKYNPILKSAQAREQMSRADAAFARAELMPRVDLRANAETDAVTPYTDNLREDTLRAEVVLSAPLFESGLRRSRLSEAQAANDADWRLVDAALREIRANLKSAWADWLAQTEAVNHLALAVKSAQDAVDGAMLQERAGMRTTLDVLVLARELLTTRSEYNDAIAREYLARASILGAVGQLGYAALQPDAQHYDSDAHFDKVRGRGDVPILTPITRALDSIGTGPMHDRPLRDPAAGQDAYSDPTGEAPPSS